MWRDVEEMKMIEREVQEGAIMQELLAPVEESLRNEDDDTSIS